MSSSGNDAESPFACGCLNLRVYTQTTSDKRSVFEDISDVLECQLGSEAVRVELRALVEVKPGSSIDPNISVVRCLLCKQAVLYYKPANPSSMPSTQQRQMPLAYSQAYLAKEAMDPKTVRESMKMSEYSEPFGVLLRPEFVGGSGARGSGHVPRDINQKVGEYMQRKEAAKNERVHEFIRAQDQALERLRRRATDECHIIADIVSQAQPQALGSQGGASSRKDSVESSGLAAMLRGRSHSNVGSLPAPSIGGRMPNPFARSGADVFKHGRGTEADGVFDLDDDDDDDEAGMLRGGLQEVGNSTVSPAGFRHVSGSAFGRGFGNRRTSSRQSDEHSDDFERDEPAFGNFDEGRMGARFSGLNVTQQQRPEERPGGGNLSQMLSGSMPRQIPTYGSSSLAGAYTLNRREHQQRADEKEMNRRREQMVRELPKTFVPPHQLMDRIHESGSSDLLIGSKPRDSHAIGRRHAPG